MDALQFLDRAAKSKRQPVYVLSGDEDFLKRRCRDAIIALTVGDADPTFAVSAYPGEKLDFSTVRNDLDTLPFLAPARVVVVEQADPFVTEHRPALERYVENPSKVGVLVLDVKSFPETTKLAKALPDAAKVKCEVPKYKLAVAPLPDGGALVIGGQTADEAGARLDTTELFDSRTGRFRSGPRMAERRYKISEAVALLADGRIAVGGGYGLETYADGRFTKAGTGGYERQFPAVVALRDGAVLVTGGYDDRTRVTGTAFLAKP